MESSSNVVTRVLAIGRNARQGKLEKVVHKSKVRHNRIVHFDYGHNVQPQPSTLLTVPLGMKNYKIVAYMRDNTASR